jgi:hypothetical protein
MRHRPFFRPAGVPGRRFGSFAPVRRLTPLTYRTALRLWLDPRGQKTIERAAKFVASQSRHLRIAHHADFNVGAGAPVNPQQFTVAFKRAWLYRAADGSPSDRGYLGKASGNNGWQICAGDGSTGANSLKIFLGTGSAVFSATTPGASGGRFQPDLSTIVVIYNGAGANQASGAAGLDGDRLIVLIDGVSAVLSFSGSVPTTIADASGAALEVGRNPLIPSIYSDVAIRGVFVWNRAIPVADLEHLLDPEDLHFEWNQAGFGVFGLLDDLVAAWMMDETSGNRVSQFNDTPSGVLHTLAEQGGTIGMAEAVVSIAARWPTSCVFTAAFGVAPFYEAQSAIGPALRFCGMQWMQAVLPAGFLSAAGDWLHAVRFATSAVQENTMLGIGRTSGTEDFFYSHVFNAAGAKTQRVRIWAEDDAPNNIVRSTKNDFTDGVSYVLNYRALGIDDDSSWTLRVNGADAGPTVYPSSPQQRDAFTGSLNAPDILTLGAFRGNGIIQGRADAFLGETLCFGTPVDSGLTTSQNRTIERWLARRCGVTI